MQLKYFDYIYRLEIRIRYTCLAFFNLTNRNTPSSIAQLSSILVGQLKQCEPKISTPAWNILWEHRLVSRIIASRNLNSLMLE